MGKLKESVRTAIMSGLIVTAALIVYDRYFAVKVAVMDVGGYVKYRQAMFMRNHKDSGLPMEDLRKAAVAYSRETQQWIDEVAAGAGPHEVVLFKDVVVNSRRVPRLTLDEEADKYAEDLRKADAGEKR